MNDYSRVIMMFSLPRSRTQWWTWFFSHGMTAWHDPLWDHAALPSFVRQVDDWLENNEGPLFIADTSAVFFHEQLHQLMPGLRHVYMFRRTQDVVDSLRAQTGLDFTDLINQQHDKLHRHGFEGAEPPLRLHWDFINADVLWAVWRLFVDAPFPSEETLAEWMAHVVDVPVLQQPHDTEKTKSLMGYKEQ